MNFGGCVLRFIGKRLLMMIPVIIGITVVIFLMLQLTPGDPARCLLGDTASQEEIDALREELGLNDPLIVQYGRFIYNFIVHQDLGISYRSRRPVMDEIITRFPTTMLLTACGVFVTLVVGVPTGIIAAIKQNSWMDKIVTFVGLIGVSMPAFWIGLLLSLVFALRLGWLPASGFYGPKYWILPAITVGLNTSSYVMRMTRSTMLETIRSDYIRTAKAKGISNNKVIIHHALANCLIPVITVIGLQIGAQLGGAMVTETIFSIPGLGKFMVDSIKTRDYPIIQGGALFIAIVFGFVNLLTDILYAYADPRIKTQYQNMKRKIKISKKGIE